MRILILSQYYTPEPVEKVHDLARGLASLGHEVEVLTGFPCYPGGRTYPGFRQKLLQREVLDAVRITRVPQWPDHSRSAWRRSLYYLTFAMSAALRGTLMRRADVMLVYQAAMPIGLAARWLKLVKRTPYVLDVVDLWPESVTSSGMLRNPVVIQVLEWLTRFVYRGAAHINAVTEGFKRRIVAMGLPPDRVGVIHNWMPSATYRVEQRDPEIAQREGLDGMYVAMYAGNMGRPQGLDTLIDAAARLEGRGIVFALIGDGTELPRLRSRVASLGLGNVRFLGRRRPEEMPFLYALADALLVHLDPDPLTNISIPSKTFAYLASGKPVVMAVAGDAGELVRSEGFGLSVEPSNPAALAEAVLTLANQPRAETERMIQAGLRAYSTKYCGEIGIARFEECLRAVVSHSSTSHPVKEPRALGNHRR